MERVENIPRFILSLATYADQNEIDNAGDEGEIALKRATLVLVDTILKRNEIVEKKEFWFDEDNVEKILDECENLATKYNAACVESESIFPLEYCEDSNEYKYRCAIWKEND